MSSSERHYAADGDTRLHLSPQLNLPLKAVNDVWTIYGKRGSGKSYFLGKTCEELNRLGIPFIIVDVKDAHSLIDLPNVSHIHMRKDGGTPINPQELIKRLGNNESIIVSMRHESTDDMREWVREFCDAINRVGFGKTFKRPVVVALEECHNFIGQGQGSAGGKGEIRSQCTASVDKLIREGRQDGVGVMLISQSVANVLANARRQAEIKVIFNIRDHTDIRQLSETLVGRNKSDVDKIIDKVYFFGVGEFICVSPTYIDHPGTVVDKTAERSTKHAGRSFIEDDGFGGGAGSGGGGDFDIESNMGTGTVYSKDSDDEDDDSPDDKDFEKSLGFSSPPTAPIKPKGKLDYKSAFGLALLALSGLGIIFVFIRKSMDKREAEKEREVESRIAKQMQKLEASQQQQQEEQQESNQPILKPSGPGEPSSAPPVKFDVDDYSPFDGDEDEFR